MRSLKLLFQISQKFLLHVRTNFANCAQLLRTCFCCNSIHVGVPARSKPISNVGGSRMQSRLHVLAILSVSLLISSGTALGQTPGTATVTISGTLQGPIYPCGNNLCPTYDSEQLHIVVNGFNATTYYNNTYGHNTAEVLARQLATQLNATSSPVTAIRNNTKITLTSKLTGTISNYPLSTPHADRRQWRPCSSGHSGRSGIE